MWLTYLLWVVFGIICIIGIVFTITAIEIGKSLIPVKPPYSLENNTIEIPFQKNPDSEVPFFRDCVVYAAKGAEYYLDDFHFREVYWLFDSEGNYICSYKIGRIVRESCVFALTPCKLGDVLIRGTLYPNGKKIINFYTLNQINEFTLSFSKFATLNNPRIVSGELKKFNNCLFSLNKALEHFSNIPLTLEMVLFW